MNIHGYKQQLKEVGRELKKGKQKLGVLKYNRLQRKKERISYNIKRLRKEKELKKKK